MLRLLSSVADHPVVAQIYPRRTIDDLLKLWEQRDALFDALDGLPQTLCHNDVFPRNLFVDHSGGTSHRVVHRRRPT